jgi:hypothetical protein
MWVFHLLAVLGGRPQMPSWSEVLGNRTIRGQKALGVPRRLEPLHAIFTLPRRPVRVLAAIIEVAALPMFPPRSPNGATCPSPKPRRASRRRLAASAGGARRPPRGAGELGTTSGGDAGATGWVGASGGKGRSRAAPAARAAWPLSWPCPGGAGRWPAGSRQGGPAAGVGASGSALARPAPGGQRGACGPTPGVGTSGRRVAGGGRTRAGGTA